MALATILLTSAICFSIPVFANESAPALSNDYKELVSGKWECLNYYHVSPATRRGSASDGYFDYTLTIQSITDGKVVGEYILNDKRGGEKTAIPLNSKIETTPKGSLRIVFRGIHGRDVWLDLQEDGSFKNSVGAVLKRVKQ